MLGPGPQRLHTGTVIRLNILEFGRTDWRLLIFFANRVISSFLNKKITSICLVGWPVFLGKGKEGGNLKSIRDKMAISTFKFQ